MVFLTMDSGGHLIYNAQANSSIAGLFVMNILRQDTFKSIIEKSLELATLIKNITPQQVEGISKADEENASSSIVSNFLKKNGFK